MKINFCVILYNKKISDSLSLTSLVKYFEKKNQLGEIIVFNNGPKIVNEQYSKYITCHQVLINGSLSKIYNKFVESYPADKYVFLDDDTQLTEEYLNELVNSDFNILLPRVFCAGEEHYPILSKDRVQSITSGLALSAVCVDNVQQLTTTLFDERFDLYGIDTAFFYTLNKHKLTYKLSNNIIEHELSHITTGSNDFREVEVLLANSAALLSYFNFKLFLVVCYGNLKKIKKFNFKVVASSVFSILLRRTIRLWRF